MPEAPPPRDPSPGWHPDPLGGKVERWWDGACWTDAVQKPGAKTWAGAPRWVWIVTGVVVAVFIVIVAT